MKTLSRNKREFYYAYYESKTSVVDDYGNETGEYKITYSKPLKAYAYISSATGIAQTEIFGGVENYDKTIVLSHLIGHIDANSVLWVDTLPQLKIDGSTDTPYDYVIKKIAESVNGVSIAISKVKVQ